MKQAALRLVEEDEEIRAGIQQGIDQPDRGELIDHDEVVARFERLLRPKIKIRWTGEAAVNLERIRNYI